MIFHLSFSASILFLSLRQSFQSLLWGLGVLSKRCVWDIQTLCLQCGYHPFLRPRPADSMQAFIVPSSLCFFDSDKPIQGRADDMEPVCHADLRIHRTSHLFSADHHHPASPKHHMGHPLERLHVLRLPFI